MTHATKTSFTEKIFIGLGVIGDMIGDNPTRVGNALVQITTDRFKNEILAGCFHRVHGRYPIGDEDYTQDANALVQYENIKQFAQNAIRGIFNAAHRQDMLDRQKELTDLRARLKDTNKPHPAGTVAELATQLGVSKSEIRRRKADGTLQELIDQQGQ